MRGLRERGLDRAIRARVEAGRPLLAICLGMQVLCEASEEAMGERGLGLVEGTVRRFPRGVRVPHMGWNRVIPVDRGAQEGERLMHDDAMYFANSYRLSEAPDGWAVARSEHGGVFVAAIEQGPVLACQFHPELSGRAGEALLSRWLARAGVVASVGRSIPC
jgi:imidazole glycerol phosphate synthase glutamine amidotransferase subunit